MIGLKKGLLGNKDREKEKDAASQVAPKLSQTERETIMKVFTMIATECPEYVTKPILFGNLFHLPLLPFLLFII
jgi:hypothetical protein